MREKTPTTLQIKFWCVQGSAGAKGAPTGKPRVGWVRGEAKEHRANRADTVRVGQRSVSEAASKHMSGVNNAGSVIAIIATHARAMGVFSTAGPRESAVQVAKALLLGGPGQRSAGSSNNANLARLISIWEQRALLPPFEVAHEPAFCPLSRQFGGGEGEGGVTHRWL